MPKNVVLAASLPAASDKPFDMYLDASCSSMLSIALRD
jgi:hypothetical protein